MLNMVSMSWCTRKNNEIVVAVGFWVLDSADVTRIGPQDVEELMKLGRPLLKKT